MKADWQGGRHLTVLTAAALIVYALAAVPTSVGAAPGATVVVTMTDKPSKFVPETVTINVGDTVEWRNTGKTIHWVTIGPPIPPGAKPFDSDSMQPGAVYRYTFMVPGHYNYVCVPHAGTGMIGVVEVTK